MRILCIGGGGMLGAHTVGRLSVEKKKYDKIIGVSTGAMMLCLLGIGDDESYEKLKQAYTTTTNKDIFSYYPFSKSGELSIRKSLIRSVCGYISIGETERLDQFIRMWFTRSDYEKLQKSDTEVIIAVLNVTTGRVEYKSSKESYSYEEFTRYVAAASSPELLTSLWEFDGWEYSDSGLATLVPIVKGSYVKGVTEIDCYVHRPFTRVIKNSKPLKRRKFLQIIKACYRYVLIQRDNLEHKELREGVLRCLIKDIPIKIYFMDNQFKQNSMVMDSKIMKEMYEYGYNNHYNKNMSIRFTKDNWEELFNNQDDE